MMMEGQKSLSRELSYHILALKTILLKHGLITEQDYEKLRVAAIAAVDQQYEKAAKLKLQQWREDWPDAMPATSLIGSNVSISCKTDRPSINAMCEIGVSHKLYVEGWELRNWYKEPSRISVFAIAYNEIKTPIGAAVLRIVPSGWFNFAVWVHGLQRRQGIGTQLVHAVRQEDDRAFVVQTSDYRHDFYKAAGVI